MRPVIALLSDFGSRDHYAGTMKGVILNICPDATLVDITHDVPPHDVLDGALQLAAAAVPPFVALARRIGQTKINFEGKPVANSGGLALFLPLAGGAVVAAGPSLEWALRVTKSRASSDC